MRSYRQLIPALLTSLIAAIPAYGGTLSNGDFSSDISASGSYNPVSVTTFTTGVWDQATGSNYAWVWSSTNERIEGGQGANTNRRDIIQWYQNDKATSGTLKLTMDVDFHNTTGDANGSNNNLSFGVEVVGWNIGDTAPVVDIVQGTTVSVSAAGTTLNGGTSLLADYDVITSRSLTAAADGFQSISFDVDLDSGYDFLYVRLMNAGGSSNNPGFFVDNVQLGDPGLSVSSLVVLDPVAADAGPVIRSVAVSNAGASQTLNISGVTFGGTAGSQFTNPVFPATLAPGAAGQIDFTFTPGAEGRATAIMTIASNAEGSPDTDLILEIKTVTPPEPLVLKIEPSGSDNLLFSWNSHPGKVYDLLTETGLSQPLGSWPAVTDQVGIAATPDTNSLIIPRPADDRRFYVVAERPAMPNIIYILADDLGYGDMVNESTSPLISTPAIDSLAANGMKFTNGHTCNGVCSPTRYGLITGQYPWRDGMWTHVDTYDPNDRRQHVDEARQTIGDMLRDAGYQTAMVGKWHLGYDDLDTTDSNSAQWGGSGSPTPPANDNIDWSAPVVGGPTTHGFDYYYGQITSASTAPYKWMQNNLWVSPNTTWTVGASVFGLSGGMRSGWADADGSDTITWTPFTVNRIVRDKSIEYVNAHAGDADPFFLYVPLPSPHTPIAPHVDFQTTKSDYLDYLEEVDDTVAQIVAALTTQGILGETLIIFTSDNGHETGYGSSGAIGGVNLRGLKRQLWEGGHRVPFLARWGDGTDAGSTIKRGVENPEMMQIDVDMMATLAELAGGTIAAGDAEDSFSMVSSLLGDGSSQGIREYLVHSGPATNSLAIRQLDTEGNEWKLIFTGGAFNNGIVNPMTTISDWSVLQLYNLTSDVGEQTNLLTTGTAGEIAAAEAKAAELQGVMQDFITSGTSVP